MIRMKQLLFDLSRPKDWPIIYLIRRAYFKIKDYDRMINCGCVANYTLMEYEGEIFIKQEYD